MSEDIKFRKTENNQTIAIKEGEVVGGAGTSVGPDKLPTFEVFKKNHEGKSASKIATLYVKEHYCNGLKAIENPKGLPKAEKIVFTTNGAKETGRAITENKMLALPYIGEVYRTGKYIGSSKDGDGHSAVMRFHYTRKTIEIQGKRYQITLCSKEMAKSAGSDPFRHYLIDKADLAQDKNLASKRFETGPEIKIQASTLEANDHILASDSQESKGVFEFFDFEVEEVNNNNRSIAFDSVSMRSVDANGFLHVERSPLTRVQVAPYLGREISGWQAQGLEPEKIYHAYRPPEELASEETIKSINGIPIHLEHHDDAGEPEDKRTRVGTTGTDGAFEAPFLINSLHVFDKDAINRINDNSMKELSLAYTYIPEFKSGVTDGGEHYDFVQRQIRANHLALVEKGRAGPTVKVSDSGKDVNMEDIDDLSSMF